MNERGCPKGQPLSFIIHPQSLRDSPGGALGTEFPRPLASLRSESRDFVIIPFVSC
mgnify:FL=1